MFPFLVRFGYPLALIGGATPVGTLFVRDAPHELADEEPQDERGFQ